jgi:alpha-L-rhamnosidase
MSAFFLSLQPVLSLFCSDALLRLPAPGSAPFAFTQATLICAAVLTLTKPAIAAEAGLEVRDLRCEWRNEPLGLDVAKPRLSWIVEAADQKSEIRGQKQTAYQALVASSQEGLVKNEGDLWDSGKVKSEISAGIEYSGQPLNSRQQCFWKIRVWDIKGEPSAWSRPSVWTMGLLCAQDWKGSWITDPVLADPANRPRTPVRCYRSELSSDPDQIKWITLDLGNLKLFDAINLMPARPKDLNWDIRTVQFPRRFRIEAADGPDFSAARTIVDQTERDAVQPLMNDCLFRFEPVTARYVRLVVTRLGVWDAQDYGVFLGQFQVLSGKNNVAVGARVACSDSMETPQWSKRFLVDGKADVGFSEFPPALATHVEGAHSPSRVPLLRKEFTLDSDVRRATLHITSRGFHEARINGNRVGDALLSPGFTAFDRRLSAPMYDVSSLLHKGANAVGVLLGYGWYAGHMNLNDNHYIYGYFPQLLAQLEIDLTDGRHLTVATDGTWRATFDGPLLWSDLLDGEASDFRKEMLGWDRPGYDDTDWRFAWQQPRDGAALVWHRAPPVREMEEIPPISMRRVRPGVFIYDLGQEIAGWCRVIANGPVGAQITLRHAEALRPDGNLDLQSLWGVAQEDDYILDGKGSRTLEPHFTYHGFRYVEMSGFVGEPQPGTLVGIGMRTETPEVSRFECSNELFNRIMTVSRRTQKNLIFDVPNGCAARGERLGWNGDIRPCARTVLFNFDSVAFFEKFLADQRCEQTPEGRFADICPHAHLRGTQLCVGTPGWADTGVTLAWDLYTQTGDLRVLADHFEAACRWVDVIDADNPDHLWLKHHGQDWGDWMSPGSRTPDDLGSTAFFAHDADLVARMATALGRNEAAARYAKLFEEVRRAFVDRYLSADGVLGVASATDQAVAGDVQGSCALALQFGLLDEPIRSKAVERLVKVLRRDGGHPTTGYWSSIELLLSLSSHGQHELAARMMNLRTEPSWGYMVDNTTTFWEAFDANVRGLSLNHWLYSGVGEWLWLNVAGLNPDPQQPGYKAFIVRPRPNWCKATYDSVRGPIGIDWQRNEAEFRLDLTVPTGSSAEVYLPTADIASVTESGLAFARAVSVKLLRKETNAAVYEVGAGVYHFRCKAL